ncbi:MAG: P-II family nitrogen regulator [bacterium]
MHLLVLVLNREEYMEEVLTIFVEAGVPGATIIDTEGMGRAVSYDIPIFATLKNIMKGTHFYNRTIFSVIEDEELLNKTIDMIRKSIDLDKEGTGILFTIPVSKVYGLTKEELKW